MQCWRTGTYAERAGDTPAGHPSLWQGAVWARTEQSCEMKPGIIKSRLCSHVELAWSGKAVARMVKPIVPGA